MEPPPPQEPWYGEPFHYPTQPIEQPTQHLPQPAAGQGSAPPNPWHAAGTHRPSPGGHRSLWIVAGVVGLCFALLAAFVIVRARAHNTSPKTPKTAATASAAQTFTGPVILVPGYGGKTTDLALLKVVLESAGKDVTIMSLPGDGTGDLTEQARDLSTLATDVLQRTGQSSLDVVGYSAGGIVARLWARDYGGAKLARRIVTMGSPHHGTTVAGLASLYGSALCPQACQELTPGSSLLNHLNSDGEVPSDPAFISIWTLNDDVVTPPETAHLDGATNITLQGLCQFHYVNHAGLPTDPVLTRAVAIELSDAVPTASPSVTC